MQARSVDGLLRACVRAIGDPGTGGRKTDVPEETLLGSVLALKQLTSMATHDAAPCLSSPPFVANTCGVLIDFGVHAGERRLRVAAMGALASLVGVAGAHPRIVAMLLPGVFTAMCGVATGDFKQGSGVIAGGLACVQAVLVACLGDGVVEAAGLLAPPRDAVQALLSLAGGGASPAAAAPPLPPPPPPQYSPATYAEEFRMDATWLQDTAARVQPRVCQVLTACTSHEHHRVRQAVASLADAVAAKCGRTLPDAALAAVEALVALADDDYVEVSEGAGGALRRCLEAYTRSPALLSGLLSELKPRFWAAVAALPRVVRGTDARAVSAHLHRLCGLTSVLGDEVAAMFAVPAASRRFHAAVAQALEVDVSASGVGVKAVTAPGAPLSEYYVKPYKHLRAPGVAADMASFLCAVVSGWGAMAAVQLFVAAAARGPYAVESSVALTLVAGGLAEGAAAEFLLHQLVGVLDGTLPKLAPLPAAASALRRACAAEAVAATGGVMGDGMLRHLHGALFPLLDALTSQDVVVRQAGLGALTQLAAQPACGAVGSPLPPVSALLTANVDYLVDTLCARLPHIAEYPTTPAIAECVARHITVHGAPLLRDVVTATLLCLETAYRPPDVQALLRVLLGLLTSTSAPEGGDSDSDDSDDSDGGDAAASEPLNAQRSALKDWRQHVERIVEAAHHYLGSSDLVIAHQAFAVVLRGCTLLSPWPRRLHPLLHRMWPGLLPRLARSSPRPSRTAGVLFVAELVATLGCGSFLRQRFLSGVWPALESTLAEGCTWGGTAAHAPHPATASPGSVVPLTGDDRVLLCVVRCVSSLATGGPESSAVLRGNVWAVCCACLPLLSRGAPPPLQVAAVSAFEALGRFVDPHSVWVFLRRCLPRVRLAPPQTAPWLPAVTLGCATKESSLQWAGHSRLLCAHVGANVRALTHTIE